MALHNSQRFASPMTEPMTAEQQAAQDGPRIINPLVKARKKSLLVGLDLIFGIFPSPKGRHF